MIWQLIGLYCTVLKNGLLLALLFRASALILVLELRTDDYEVWSDIPPDLINLANDPRD